MKLNKTSIIALLASLTFGLASCEREYDAPLLTEPTVTVGNEGLITIAEYKEKYKNLPKEGQLIEEDFAIRAVVVGNDVSGNIYKQIYVQDATGGISIGIDQNNIANDYHVGQEVYIKLQGLAATSYGGVTQIGMLATQSNRIPYEIVKKQVLKDKWPNADNAQPTVTTIGALSDAMVGTLIQLEDVYFDKGGVLPFADSNLNAVNRALKDRSGKTLSVRNSQYATFANDLLPKGNGTVVGILSKFNSDYQLFLRTADDCFGFSGKEPETSGGNTDTPKPEEPATGAVIYSETFAADLGKMTAVNVSGAQTWRANTQFKNANMSGFANNQSNANEDWLVSPVFDLSAAKSMSITFKHTINKGDVSKMTSEQTVWVSNNYTGDVKTATWTQINIPNYPAGTDWTYVESGTLNIPASSLGQSKVVFAFKYLCTDQSSANWQVQELKVHSDGGKVADGTTPTPTPDPTPDPDPTPGTAELLFPGSNFDDWKAFTGALNSYGLKDYATQVDGGVTGKAMQIKVTPENNDYVFTATVPAGSPATASKITLYIKGTAQGKSLSFNVYTNDGAYTPFNLGDVTGSGDVTVEPTEKNGYNGTIDTKGKWVKVTLNISGLQLATSGSFFALKVGKEAAWDLMVDDITIE
ncbi:MAG: DUF5689 domain-containing protein [Porphyromonas sp.]|nr:DUF5689 domain-containing protein [Porphyromonas sp.]